MRRRIHGVAGRTPLSVKQLDIVVSNFCGMRNRLRTLITHNVTQDDLLATFAKPQHRELLTAAADIVAGERRFSTSLGGSFHPGVVIDITIRNDIKFLLPKYAGKHFELSEGVQKLRAFAEELLQLWQEYHVGVEAIRALNLRCNTLQQMRFFLKCLPALGVECGYKVPTTMPDIPRELRDALRSVDEFVARASMLPKKAKQDEHEVELGLSGNVSVPCPWSDSTIRYYL
jgi:hypothetical protein